MDFAGVNVPPPPPPSFTTETTSTVATPDAMAALLDIQPISAAVNGVEVPIDTSTPLMGILEPEVPTQNVVEEIINNFIPNPNMELVTEELDESNAMIPGVIRRDEEGKLVKKYIVSKGITQFLIDGYDAWMENDLPKRLSSKKLITPSGKEVEIVLVDTVPPKTSSGDMYPSVALHERSNYSVDLNVKLVYRNGDQSLESNVFSLGKIPLMLGSKKCYLRDKSPQERIKVGTMGSDPLGYFIVKGVERVVLLQEQLRTGMLTMMKLKSEVVCRIMGMTDRGSHQAAVSIGKNGVMNYKMSSFCSVPEDPESQQMPVLQIFRYFGYNADQAWEMIKNFIPEKRQNQCRMLMIPSFTMLHNNREFLPVASCAEEDMQNRGWYMLRDSYRGYLKFLHVNGVLHDAYHPEFPLFAQYDNGYEYLTGNANSMSFDVTDVEFIAKKLYRTATNPMANKNPDQRQLCKTKEFYDTYKDELEEPGNKINRVEQALNNDIFPYLGSTLEETFDTEDEEFRRSIIDRKMQMLALMVSKRLLYETGDLLLADLNHWGNKKLETAGKMMDQVFRTIYRMVLSNVQKELDSKPYQTRSTDVTVADLNMIAQMVSAKASKITDVFVSSFTTSTWGVNGKIKKQNAAVEIKRDNLVSALSHLLRISVSIERNDKQAVIRFVQNSQYGYICPIETPEGDTCGIVKNLAMLCYITIDVDDAPILQLLTDPRLTEPSYQIKTHRDDTTGHINPLIVNSKFMGWANGPGARSQLIKWRRAGAIDRMACIMLNPVDGILYVLTDASRCTRPLLIVNEDGSLVLDGVDATGRLNRSKRTFEEILEAGCVEYIDAWEQETIKLASTLRDIEFFFSEIEQAQEEMDSAIEFNRQWHEGITKRVIRGEELVDVIITRDEAADSVKYATEKYQRLNARRRYTHCEMDPSAILGIVAALIPMPETNQGPRNTFQSAMGKQAVSIYHDFHSQRFDGTVRVLAYPSRPFFEPQLATILDPNGMSAGQMITVAFMSFTGFNQEDAFIFNAASIQQGKFAVVKYFTYKVEIKQGGVKSEQMRRPDVRAGDFNSEKYRFIDDNGLPFIGAYLRQGDCVVGKIRGDGSNGSEFVRIGEQGYVENVKITENGSVTTVVVKLRILRYPEEGDKFAPRNAQKGTIGLILPPELMPQTESGVIPDIIANPHCIVSRMTMEYLLEIIAGKYTALKGERVDATAFRDFDMDQCRRALKDRGFEEYGYEMMTDGVTGRPIEAQIFMGPAYFQRLKHDVADKFQARQQGSVNPTHGQPNKGKRQGGGLRIGEQERDALIAHGVSETLKERLMYASDPYTAVFCQKCGHEARADQETHNYKCRLCGDSAEYGKCTIPKAFKLLQNNLMVMGIGTPFGFGTKEEYRLGKKKKFVSPNKFIGALDLAEEIPDEEEVPDDEEVEEEEEDEIDEDEGSGDEDDLEDQEVVIEYDNEEEGNDDGDLDAVAFN